VIAFVSSLPSFSISRLRPAKTSKEWTKTRLDLKAYLVSKCTEARVDKKRRKN
jgi:hypothetical protein